MITSCFRWLGWVAFAAVFFLFTYNSGYGYDAIEYLVLAQAWLDGHSIFDYSPSKPPGIYLLVSWFLRFVPHAGHFEISALITFIFILAVGATYRLVKGSLGRTAAYIAAGLLALSGFFMEMNFLETEPFVFLLSLPALPALRDGLRRSTVIPFAMAGALIGAATFFKTVALFYAVGAAVFIAAWARAKNGDSWIVIFRYWAGFAMGLVLLLGAPLVVYAARGEAQPFFYWTYFFPAFHYPSDTLYFSKLLIKLAWFWIALVLGLLLLVHPRVRAPLVMCVYPTAALTLGMSALLALTKNQASHYVFPAAGFLCIFLGAVFGALAESIARYRYVMLFLSAIVAGLVAANALLYRPRALSRLFTIADYSEENRLSQRLQSLVPKDRTMLCLSHPLPYWLARRPPAIPSFATHVQFAELFRRDPALLARALDNPKLLLVEFDPAWTTFRAPALKTDPAARAALADFHARLRQRFRPIALPDSPFHFWLKVPDNNI